MLYYIWDAEKEVGMVGEIDKHYKNEHAPIINIHHKNVKPAALLHMMCVEHSNSELISPSKWAKVVEDAKNEFALHVSDQEVYAEQIIVWRAGAEVA